MTSSGPGAPFFASGAGVEAGAAEAGFGPEEEQPASSEKAATATTAKVGFTKSPVDARNPAAFGRRASGIRGSENVRESRAQPAIELTSQKA